LQNATALSNGGIQVVMPGSGSGGGSGGGSGISLRAGQHIESKSRGAIRIEDVELGEQILGRRDWIEVVAKKVLAQDHFVQVSLSNAEHVTFTPTHHTTAIRDGVEQSIAAGKLTVSDFLIIRDGYAAITNIQRITEPGLKVSLSCEPEHEFFISESKSVSVLAHNALPIS
jgi:hypothetical protein